MHIFHSLADVFFAKSQKVAMQSPLFLGATYEILPEKTVGILVKQMPNEASDAYAFWFIDTAGKYFVLGLSQYSKQPPSVFSRFHRIGNKIAAEEVEKASARKMPLEDTV